MANKHVEYSEAYVLKCRAIWYEYGSPSARVAIAKNIFPPDELGRVVEHGTLRHWITDKDWYIWKDEQDTKLASKIDEELVARKFLLVKEQLGQVREMRNSAFEHLKENGFDPSAAAASAFFKATVEERALVGIDEILEKIPKMGTPEIKQRFRELAERAQATDVIDVAEAEDAEPLD